MEQEKSRKKKESRKAKVKVFLHTGKILTIDVSKQTDDKIIGTDLFNVPVVIPITEIKSMYPVTSSAEVRK